MSALDNLGKIPDAIRILNALKKNTEIQLAIAIGLRVAYSSEAVVGKINAPTPAKCIVNSDRESLKDVDAQINVLWTSPKPTGAYLASVLLSFEATYDRARSLLDQIISTTASNAVVSATAGFTLLARRYNFMKTALVSGSTWLGGRTVKEGFQICTSKF